MVIFLGKSYFVIHHTLSISLFSGAKESVYCSEVHSKIECVTQEDQCS